MPLFTIANIYLLLLLDRHSCTNCMRIVGQWCSTPLTESQKTLDSVPYLVNFATLYFYSVVPVQESFYLPPITTLPPPLPPPPLPYPASLIYQLPPVPTTASPLAPPVTFLTPHTGLTVTVWQYTV